MCSGGQLPAWIVRRIHMRKTRPAAATSKNGSPFHINHALLERSRQLHAGIDEIHVGCNIHWQGIAITANSRSVGVFRLYAALVSRLLSSNFPHHAPHRTPLPSRSSLAMALFWAEVPLSRFQGIHTSYWSSNQI